MPKIQVLDKHTAELIAAGEVVERPASVVKELLENAIDAGASSVTVEIRQGGVGSLSISDDGCGIAREDVPTAFLRHATSKVRTEEDLEAIGTLGFRGEAMASVAAVSRVELRTRTADELAGTLYRIEGGNEVALEDIGCPRGTTIVVRELFYNVPARMKFLKKDVSEGNAVAGVVERLALSHPEVAFRFVREGREECVTPGDGKLLSAIYAVLGKEFANSLMPLEYREGGVYVHGYVSKPQSSRANRTMQHFFINGRYVKTRTAMAALEQAYRGAIMTGKFPACVLHLDMPPAVVDANVHPAKIEVRFINEKPVFDAVYHGARSAVESGAAGYKQGVLSADKPSAPSSTLSSDAAPASILPGTFPSANASADIHTAPLPVNGVPSTSPVVPTQKPVTRIDSTEAAAAYSRSAGTSVRSIMRDEGAAAYAAFVQPSIDIVYTEPESTSVPASVPPARKETQQAEQSDAPVNKISVKSAADPMQRDEVSAQPEALPLMEESKPPVVRYIGEIFQTYILAEMDGALFVIDKHAAHERLLYNELRANARSDAQMLLSPVTVTLSREEYTALLAETETLQQAGFEIEDFGGCSVLLRAAPMLLADGGVEDTLRELATGFLSGRREVATDKLDWIYHNTACRAAIKAGDSSNPGELRTLAERVLLHDDVRTCPHGRPVCVELTQKELEKQFGRAGTV